MKILLICSILFALNACQSTITQSQKPEFIMTSSKDAPTSTPIDHSDNPFLTETFEQSEKILNKAILEKNADVIRKALLSRFVSIETRAVEALTEMEDKESIPDIIQLLQTNQAIVDGGTEVQGPKNNLNKVILLSLEKLTGLKFAATEKLIKSDGRSYAPMEPEDIQEIKNKIANLDRRP
jgi:hypothetical protein